MYNKSRNSREILFAPEASLVNVGFIKEDAWRELNVLASRDYLGIGWRRGLYSNSHTALSGSQVLIYCKSVT